MIENFVFRKEWYDVLKGCSADVRNEVYEAVMTYAFEDCVVEMSAMAQMAFAFIRPQIDAMREKYEAKCEQNKANASSRKRPQATASEDERPQATASDIIQYNTIQQNKIKQECECDNNAPTHTHEVFNKFLDFCRAKAPLALAFEEPLTVEVLDFLVAKYGLYRVQCCASDIHNKEAYKTNRNANNVFKRWIKNIT